LLFFHGVQGVLWVAELFVIIGCLVASHSTDLFSMEGLVVRYKFYLLCTRLRGSSWKNAGMMQLDRIFVDFARDNSCFFVVSLPSRHV
jgi:hypothetical protein